MDSRFGKFVNDIPKRLANLIMKKITVNETPHLCLFAAQDIHIGEELRFFDNSTFFSFFNYC